ncbi:hypothetical protein [Streptomyces sp. WAC07149]|uniref:hypothetical protein n=1 Tax=Streptomyces sp. WAC07149 TaxID=2487425 RepID=UPI00163C27ED|nr:hypothetical protein [Streptomyces sp. WAC07149]
MTGEAITYDGHVINPGEVFHPFDDYEVTYLGIKKNWLYLRDSHGIFVKAIKEA